MKIDFQSLDNQVLLNPRLSFADQQKFQAWALEVFEKYNLTGHFALQTSGSTMKSGQSSKLVFLSKLAILNSARAVNEHLQVNANDRWLSVLPIFHVGGLGVWARAFLSGSSVFELLPKVDGEEVKWTAQAFAKTCEEFGITLSSLVPTQVFDLVQEGIVAPSSLRAIVVGGGALSSELYFAARRLGWPLLPSYGMTETASQIATADLKSLGSEIYPELVLLKHAKVQVNESGFLRIHCSSLLTSYAQWSDDKLQVSSPLDAGGWFTTEDKGSLAEGALRVFGRGGDYIKVGGEAVNVAKLRAVFEEMTLSLAPDLMPTVALGKLVDSRLGHKVVLFQVGDVDAIRIVVEKFNRQVMPYERIKSRYRVAEIPRSELGKVLWSTLEEMERQEI